MTRGALETGFWTPGLISVASPSGPCFVLFSDTTFFKPDHIGICLSQKFFEANTHHGAIVFFDRRKGKKKQNPWVTVLLLYIYGLATDGNKMACEHGHELHFVLCLFEEKQPQMDMFHNRCFCISACWSGAPVGLSTWWCVWLCAPSRRCPPLHSSRLLWRSLPTRSQTRSPWSWWVHTGTHTNTHTHTQTHTQATFSCKRRGREERIRFMQFTKKACCLYPF